MVENKCEHRICKTVTCCGGAQREVIYCSRYDHICNDMICQHCNGGQPPITRTEAVTSIAAGYFNLLTSGGPSEYSLMVKQRLAACGECQFRTYLSVLEYNSWIKENGGYGKFIAEINRLQEWPDLPDNKDETNGEMFCRKCKCFLKAKAHLKDANCPIGHPAWLSNEKEQHNG